ncbi:hypothetical protein [Pseudonocardia alaniniphila]|uniref:Uncharacterized protein n=1 Tax=Pseudonocardia alaniniphila TaxID=75291 RepID=A0ABS9TUV4_9PSEU|nr:hypothetical protein [Pseudonocardia alaniniphila]MCH6172183.1 hypothetical protein [Pseudonocardia alaniniphila]
MVASDLVLPVTSRTVPRLRGEHELCAFPSPVSPARGGRDAEKLRASEHPGGAA